MTSKPWYTSITVIASAIVVALQAIAAAVPQIDAATGWSLATNPTVISILSVISTIVAIWGRFRATTTLK